MLFAYPPEVVDESRGTAEDLRRALAARVEPFDGTGPLGLKALIKE